MLFIIGPMNNFIQYGQKSEFSKAIEDDYS